MLFNPSSPLTRGNFYEDELAVLSEIIVHVGLAKTGSTSIQNFLCLNKKILLSEHRILVPSEQADHWHFQSLFSESPHNLIQIRRLGIGNEDEARAFVANYKRAFEDELRTADADRLIISTEYLSAMSPAEMSLLFSYLRQFCDNIKIIAYVRDPWSFSLSYIQQIIRDGYRSGAVRPGYCAGNVEILRIFEETSGSRPSVRPYIATPSSPFDVISDFIKQIGIADCDNLQRPLETHSNISISFEAACLLSMFNKYFPAFGEGGIFQNNPARDWATDAILSAVGGRPLRMSDASAKAILQQAMQDLDVLQERYLEGSDVYFEFYRSMKFAADSDAIDIAALGGEEIVRLMSTALMEMAQRALDQRAWALHLQARLSEIEKELARTQER